MEHFQQLETLYNLMKKTMEIGKTMEISGIIIN